MKLTITADAYSLTSTIKVADIEFLKKYKPAALQIVDEEGNAKFGISYSEGCSSVAAFGVTFSGATRDENGYATVTGILPSGLGTTAEAKEFVAEKFGGIVAYLKQLEESIPNVVAQIKAERNQLIDSITVA